MNLCLHENFESRVDVIRLVDEDRPLRFRADVQVRCAQCGENFMFTGIEDVGYRQARPSVNVNRQEVSLPIAPWDGQIATGNIIYEFGEPKA